MKRSGCGHINFKANFEKPSTAQYQFFLLRNKIKHLFISVCGSGTGIPDEGLQHGFTLETSGKVPARRMMWQLSSVES